MDHDVETETGPRRVTWNVVIDTNAVATLLFGIAVVVVILGIGWMMWTNSINAHETDTEKRVAEVRACENLEDGSERILCLRD